MDYYQRALTAEARVEELECDLEEARWEIVELEKIADEYQDARRTAEQEYLNALAVLPT